MPGRALPVRVPWPKVRHHSLTLIVPMAPGIVLAGVAVFWLMHRQQRAAMV
ncbi:hypothetical protein G7B13_26565 [Klebsiella pneumoniae]|nr:hypothetical protein [Klebsiella pneumoniae]